MSSAPWIEYEYETEGPETQDDEKVRAKVMASNGEQLYATEWYDSKSNTDRGLAEIASATLALTVTGEIDLSRAT